MFVNLSLLIATFLVSLVAGFLWSFTIVVLPGIQALDDHDFLQSFKAMDLVIQSNQPVFIGVWVGAAIMLVVTTFGGLVYWDAFPRILLLLATALFLFGVQLPTLRVNIPLNNQLQARALETLDAEALQRARTQFEARWIWWNAFRTTSSLVTAFILMTLLLRA